MKVSPAELKTMKAMAKRHAGGNLTKLLIDVCWSYLYDTKK